MTLTDGAGNSVSTLVSTWSRSLYYPPGGSQQYANFPPRRELLNDVRIPLAAFAGVNLTDVRSVRFSFDQQSQGAFLLSDLAFEDAASLYAGPFVVSNTMSDAVGASSVQVAFNTPIDASTFTAADVVLTGPGGALIPVTGVAVVPNSGNARFNILFNPQGAIGFYTMVLGPDIRDLAGQALDENFNGVPGEVADQYAFQFSLRGPRILASTPSGPVAGPVSSVQLTFNTAMDVATFSPAQDFRFTGPGGVLIPVTGVSVVAGSAGRQFNVTFAPQTAPRHLHHGHRPGPSRHLRERDGPER